MRVIALLLLLGNPAFAEDLRITTKAPETIDVGRAAIWRVLIENVSGRELASAPLSLQFTPGNIGALTPDLDCDVSLGGEASCTLPSLVAGASMAIEAFVTHPFRYGRVFAGVAVSFVPGKPETNYQSNTYWREFLVTTVADAGPGSLRTAILEINAAPECRQRANVWTAPCKATFRISDPVPPEGWYTIRPASPLPPLTAADSGIDASDQAAANPLGPTVALDGSDLWFGNGITVTQHSAEVKGLAIGAFPWNGIAATGEARLSVRNCYIGVEPTGRHAHPNGARGIVSRGAWGLVEGNVIGGNRQSGVFFEGPDGTGPQIRSNRIGVAAHDDTPIGNGASGVFIGRFFGYYANPTIEGNVIANNAHFGVALTANSPMIILGNSVRDNGQGGIDIGLDGPTDSVPGVPGVEGGVVSPPVILSARYENGVTTISGYSLAGNSRRQVVLYANTELEPGGFAEGEQFLGVTPLTYREQTAFTFEVRIDLRGKYINGTSSAVSFWGWDEYSYTTSEFGRAVRVE